MDINEVLKQIEDSPHDGIEKVQFNVKMLKDLVAYTRTIEQSLNHYKLQQLATEKAKPVLSYRHNQHTQVEILDYAFFKNIGLQSVDLYAHKPIQHVWPNIEYGELVKFNQLLVLENNELKARLGEVDKQGAEK